MIIDNELRSMSAARAYSIVYSVISSNSRMDVPTLIGAVTSRVLDTIRTCLHWGVNRHVRVLPWMTTRGSMFGEASRLIGSGVFDFEGAAVSLSGSTRLHRSGGILYSHLDIGGEVGSAIGTEVSVELTERVISGVDPNLARLRLHTPVRRNHTVFNLFVKEEDDAG